MNIVGISAFYHDSAAALIMAGETIAAAQEERFTRIKHDASFPKKALSFCLEQGGISIADVDYVVFYDKPLLTFDRILETYSAFSPIGFSSFCKAIPIWLKEKLFTKKNIKKFLGEEFIGKVAFTEHHESHAAAAFYPSPFKESAVLTIDGVGEWATATISKGTGNKLEILKEMRFPHSLGLLYSAFTYYCGFKVNSGEYKLMGLAPYGKPTFVEKIKQIVKVYDDGSLWMDMSYFNYCQGLTMTSNKFADFFGGEPRKSESEITQREMDLAASIQALTEEVMIKMAKYAKELTSSDNLCLSGGVALNCVANGKLLKEALFNEIWIQPAAGDAGSALGAAHFLWHQLLDNERKVNPVDSMKGSLLGNSFTESDIRSYLEESEIPHKYYPDEGLYEDVASLINEEKVIGWFQGRMEFGPRSLGGRSIIGDARSEKMQSIMNLKIKYRESFRPFAPSVLVEDYKDYFDLDSESPYMLLVAPVDSEQVIEQTLEQRKVMESDSDLCKRVVVPRSKIPAVTHIDYSARVQTVDEQRNPAYYKLIKAFQKKSKSSVIINTSFNIRGEPIVCTPQDAYRCFMNTDMDVLVLENFVLFKSAQKMDAIEIDEYKKSFTLD